MRAYLRHLEQVVGENDDFRRVLFTTHLMQVCLICLRPHEELGMKLHDADHFYLVVQGGGKAVIEGLRRVLSAGYGLLSPAGTAHNIVNTGTVPMKLCEVAAPPRYRQGGVYRTRPEAQAEDDLFAGSPRAHAANSEAQASWVLGLLALHGVAMPVNLAQASSRFEHARQLGHPMAAAGLAWCAVATGVGRAQVTAARAWLAELALVNVGRALYLDWLIEQKLAATLPPPAEPMRARRAGACGDKLARAADAGDAQALTELGMRSAQRGALSHALDYFRRAAARSPAAAANAAVLSAYLQAQHEAFHQSMPPLQRDPTPLYDLVPARWRLVGSRTGARKTVHINQGGE